MTTIRRTILLLIILAIAFFIYRGINPRGADLLLVRIKTISERFFGSGNVTSLTGTLMSGQVVSGQYIDSGALDTTGRSEILSGMESSGDELILGDLGSPLTGSTSSGPILTGTSSPVVTPPHIVAPVTSSSSPKGLSAKDRSDMEKLLHLFQ